MDGRPHLFHNLPLPFWFLHRYQPTPHSDRGIRMWTTCLRLLRSSAQTGEIYKSAKAQIFSHYESAKKLLHKRNSDRNRELQQLFTRPQTVPFWRITDQYNSVHLILSPRTVITDFEKAAMNAVSNYILKCISSTIATVVFVRFSSNLAYGSHVWQRRPISMVNNTGSSKRASTVNLLPV